jgi:N-formylglutamate amidohydrolase
VPLQYLGKDRRVHALMIELRRDLYMDEEAGGRLPGFAGCAAAVQTALRRIIA